jgi:hypothetical protein
MGSDRPDKEKTVWEDTWGRNSGNSGPFEVVGAKTPREGEAEDGANEATKGQNMKAFCATLGSLPPKAKAFT